MVKGFIFNRISFINGNPYEPGIEKDGFSDYSYPLLQLAKRQLNDICFLGSAGKETFSTIFLEYMNKVLKEQITQYLYLSKIIQKYKINATLCQGHDTPESYFCKYLMDKHVGISYFLPHGLVWKDKMFFKYRESLAHYYFCYSEGEKLGWLNNYDIPEKNILPIRFLKKEKRKYKVNEKLNETSVLIVQDFFMASLISRINCFKFFRELVNLLRSLGFMKIDFRFNGYMQYLENNREIIDKFFFSLPIQGYSDVALRDVIHKYDIVIGSVSTCVYEAMCNSVFYIPYTPNFFPYRNLEKINELFWFKDLFPVPNTNLEKIKNVLLDYIGSPADIYKKFYNSVEMVNVYEDEKPSLWEIIVEHSDKKQQQ